MFFPLGQYTVVLSGLSKSFAGNPPTAVDAAQIFNLRFATSFPLMLHNLSSSPWHSCPPKDRRLRARRLARQSGAARIISAAETRRREAEEQAITREEAAARARGKVVRQEEMKMEALKVCS